ncbi:pyridoxamine 5'-phosphate oxidase family protein [Euzebya pacifica]|uniref:pyridoxamine 5'-phosphate oxidase family protein n=1 Tax=Euzebya pacifica TaxID=1608957 RepID=UPI0030FCE21C
MSDISPPPRSADRRWTPAEDGRGEPGSDRVKVRRDTKKRGRYDADAVHAILDATPFCHIAYVHDGHPIVIPTLQARIDDHVYLHASSGSRLGLSADTPWPISLSVTLIDGLVMARSGFHHSVNYRSVVVVGDAVLVTDREEMLRALDTTVDHVAPGRAAELRRPTERELSATVVARLPLAEASVKTRSGPPNDEPEDMDLPVWAGVVPMTTTFGPPLPSPDLADDIAVSPSVRRLTG